MVRSSLCHVEIAHFKGTRHYLARLSRLLNEHYEHALQSWSDTQVKLVSAQPFSSFGLFQALIGNLGQLTCFLQHLLMNLRQLPGVNAS